MIVRFFLLKFRPGVCILRRKKQTYRLYLASRQKEPVFRRGCEQKTHRQLYQSRALRHTFKQVVITGSNAAEGHHFKRPMPGLHHLRQVMH